MAVAQFPNEVAFLQDNIRSRFPTADIAIDAPSKPEGNWFIDVRLHGHVIAIEWRRNGEIGLTTNPSGSGIGLGEDETFGNPKDAYQRIVELLRNKSHTVAPEPVRLRDLRSMRGLSQVKLAELLRVQQGAISKLEHRAEIRLGTLKAVIAALGGELRVTAKFPDGTEAQLQIDDEAVPAQRKTRRTR